MNHTNKIILVVIILLGLATTTLAQTDAEVITPDNAGQLQLVYELDVPGLSYGNVRLSSDGSLLAASTDTKVTIWDLANQSSMGSYPVSYENELIGFTPDNRYFVYTDFVYTDEATIYLWDVTSGDLHSFDLEDGTDKIMILSVAISPDGHYVAAISGIWGAASPVEISLISVNDLTITSETVEYSFALAFSADGSLLVTTGNKSDLLVWSIKDNSLEVVRTLSIETSNSFGFIDPIFTCEGLNIVVENVTSDWMIDLATDETKQLMAGIRGFDNRTCGHVFLFTSNNNDRLFVNVLTGESLFIWDNPEEFGRLLAIAPNGTIAVVELVDGFVLWNTKTGSDVFSLDFPEIENADFSSDGRFLAVWDFDSLIQVWAVLSD